ncbi:hypothetical protein [Micromonospora sp. 050-3]|uniref:hypothetical protein n=1 Tax=Micromonospora sp. 050-3 TaxID=2789265 RepID=UPI00397A6BEB
MGNVVDDNRIEVNADRWGLAAARKRGYLDQGERTGLTVDLGEDAERHCREHARSDSRPHGQ